ncbi:MAG TPA: chemotaxis protein, partial [Sulfurimonas sp. UBA10385]
MTQEELDALMSGDIEDLESLSDDISHDSKDDADIEEEFEEEPKELKNSSDKPAGYSKETAHHWPLPATNENKMVHQLDDVTKESEEKASEIFDLIENVSNELMEKEENLNSVIEVLESN